MTLWALDGGACLPRGNVCRVKMRLCRQALLLLPSSPACPTPRASSSWPPCKLEISLPQILLFRDSFIYLFFWCGPFLKVFIEFVTVLLVLCLVFWSQDMWDLSYLTRNRTCTPALEGGVLTTGPPGKSHIQRFLAPAWLFLVLLSLPVPSSPEMS